MKSLYGDRTVTAIPKLTSVGCNRFSARTNLAVPALNFLVPSQSLVRKIVLFQPQTALRSQSASNPETQMDGEEDPDAQVEALTIPEHYLLPSKALEVYNLQFGHTLCVIVFISVCLIVLMRMDVGIRVVEGDFA